MLAELCGQPWEGHPCFSSNDMLGFEGKSEEFVTGVAAVTVTRTKSEMRLVGSFMTLMMMRIPKSEWTTSRRMEAVSIGVPRTEGG